MSNCDPQSLETPVFGPTAVQNVQVSFIPSITPNQGRYKVTATITPITNGATGIPKATVFLIGGGNPMVNPMLNQLMTRGSNANEWFAETFPVQKPTPGYSYFAQVVVDWQLSLRESADSPFKTAT